MTEQEIKELAYNCANELYAHFGEQDSINLMASEVRCYPVDRALELADKLIAECEKGDNNA